MVLGKEKEAATIETVKLGKVPKVGKLRLTLTLNLVK